MPQATRLRLLSRPGCRLCEEMASALREFEVPFETVNVEEDAALEAAYGESIPVLMIGDLEVVRAPQSRRTLKHALQQTGVI
jgi:glutaredoxin